MTCADCGRADTALLGALCGICSARISGAVSEAIEESGSSLGSDIIDVYRNKNGAFVIRVDAFDDWDGSFGSDGRETRSD